MRRGNDEIRPVMVEVQDFHVNQAQIHNID
jgi:hypothetical protein